MHQGQDSSRFMSTACNQLKRLSPPSVETCSSHDAREKNASFILSHRSAINRKEMLQLIKDLCKDREQAERDRQIAIQIIHEIQAFDEIVSKKVGGVQETFAACSETMAEIHFLLSTLREDRVLKSTALEKATSSRAA